MPERQFDISKLNFGSFRNLTVDIITANYDIREYEYGKESPKLAIVNDPEIRAFVTRRFIA